MQYFNFKVNEYEQNKNKDVFYNYLQTFIEFLTQRFTAP